ncbi:MAG TPA: hypothetical protein VMV16_01060 [Solirubrobacteraceae bacterium]|nr:hypothetical protein [Solirubrobacteraceae bacterium]
MALEPENNYFDTHRAELLKQHRNEFVLIHGDDVIGAYATFDAAYTAGVQALGIEPFLVRQVLDREPPAQFPALMLGMLSAQLS